MNKHDQIGITLIFFVICCWLLLPALSGLLRIGVAVLATIAALLIMEWVEHNEVKKK